MYKPASRALGAVTAVLLLAGCGAGDGADADETPGLDLVASFYPLQFAVERVVGDTAAVTSLTQPGGEPHDLELSPRDVATVGDADLVVYLAGFQPAVDEAVGQEAADTSLDVAAAARLDLTYEPIEEGEAAAAGAVDPHFWLDPTRLADVADAIAGRLGEISPGDAATYERNAAALRVELTALDAELADGLSTCTDRNIVTSHTAFGYLAERYDLRQVGITGLTAEEEPSPQDLAAVTRFVDDNDVATIYYETLASPAVAETVAAETGADTAVLDPIEGINDESAGEDYVAVMRANLASLQDGQSCS